MQLDGTDGDASFAALLQVSSMGGTVAFPSFGVYHASEWALEGLTEALAAEVGMFGIRTTILEPGGYATDRGGASASAYSGPTRGQETLTARGASARDGHSLIASCGYRA